MACRNTWRWHTHVGKRRSPTAITNKPVSRRRSPKQITKSAPDADVCAWNSGRNTYLDNHRMFADRGDDRDPKGRAQLVAAVQEDQMKNFARHSFSVAQGCRYLGNNASRTGRTSGTVSETTVPQRMTRRPSYPAVNAWTNASPSAARSMFFLLLGVGRRGPLEFEGGSVNGAHSTAAKPRPAAGVDPVAKTKLAPAVLKQDRAALKKWEQLDGEAAALRRQAELEELAASEAKKLAGTSRGRGSSAGSQTTPRSRNTRSTEHRRLVDRHIDAMLVKLKEMFERRVQAARAAGR